MESKRPTRCPPATPLRNYSSRRAAQLSNELINTNRTRQKYNQPVRNKHRWPYRGCSPQPGPWIQRAARSTHPPPARPAAPPSQPPHGPSRPRAAPALPGSAPAPQTASGPQQPPSGGDGRRRRRVRREEGDAKVEAQPRVAALRAMPAAAHRQEQAAAMSRRSPLVAAAPLPGYGRGAAGAGGDEAGARPYPRCTARRGSRLPPRPAPGSPTGARRGAGRNG